MLHEGAMPRRRRVVEEREKATDQLSIRVSPETKTNMITLFHLGKALGLWSNWNDMMKLGYRLLSMLIAIGSKGGRIDVEKSIECVMLKLEECSGSSGIVV